MRNWNRLTVMLPAGLAIAALCVPARTGIADEPAAVQAAVEQRPRQSPHFFTGSPTLSGFQRLAMPAVPEPAPVQLSAVKVLPVPGVEVPVIPQPQPEKVAVRERPAIASQQNVEQTASSNESPSAAKITWAEKDQRRPHYFPNSFPVPLAERLAVLEQHFATPTALPARLLPTEVLAAAPPKFKEEPLTVAVSPLPATSTVAKPLVSPAPVATAVQPAALTASVPKPKSPVPFIAQEDRILRGPEHFIRPAKAELLERDAALVAPPLKQLAAEPATKPESPGTIEPRRPLMTFASQPIKRAEPASPPPVAAVVALPKIPVAETPKRLETPASQPANDTLLNPADLRLQPAAVAELPSVEELTSLSKPTLIRLPPAGPEPTAPLIAAAVQPAATIPAVSPLILPGFPAMPREEFQLASYPSPQPTPNSRPTGVSAQPVAIQLQPTEVLPGPTNSSPSRGPAIDTERPIGAVTTTVAPPTGRLPSDLAVERFRDDYPAYLPRGWEDTVYFWDAPSMCIGPLRYEEANLERLGYSHCPVLQPAFSGARFLGSTLALPYTLAINPPGTCKYPLGHYRPGSPAPYRHIWPEPSVHGASAECLAIAGLILLIP